MDGGGIGKCEGLGSLEGCGEGMGDVVGDEGVLLPVSLARELRWVRSEGESGWRLQTVFR